MVNVIFSVELLHRGAQTALPSDLFIKPLKLSKLLLACAEVYLASFSLLLWESLSPGFPNGFHIQAHMFSAGAGQEAVR